MNMKMNFELHLGDCVESMRKMPAASVDSIVTDPPYELGFMGNAWDATGIANNPAMWAEALRVLKPGGHLLAFSGSRTYHRMVCAIEDAGFEIRDQIMWVYGSGMPKAKTTLKPSHEPICFARKPLDGAIIANAAKWGTGLLNIDACRVGDEPRFNPSASSNDIYGQFKGAETGGRDCIGRWPANLIHDGSDEVLAGFPDAPGQQAATAKRQQGHVYGAVDGGTEGVEPRADVGSAARFFYCAKASRKDRGAGNVHPTVKPTDLMRYLCRLVTPAGGTVLDPFTGSGSTGKAAVLEGFRFVGCELDEAYLTIAQTRINDAVFGGFA